MKHRTPPRVLGTAAEITLGLVGTPRAPVAIPMNGIWLNGGTVPGDTYAICTQVGGAGALANTINGSGAHGGNRRAASAAPVDDGEAART